MSDGSMEIDIGLSRGDELAAAGIIGPVASRVYALRDEGVDVKTVADVLDISESRVYNAYSDARERLAGVQRTVDVVGETVDVGPERLDVGNRPADSFVRAFNADGQLRVDAEGG